MCSFLSSSPLWARTWIQLVQSTLVAFLLVPLVTSSGDQQPLGTVTDATTRRIAIIGAGAAGSANAYNLRRLSESSQLPVDITVFERESYIGGRSTTVNVFGNPEYPVEVGGSIFVDVNYILVNASKELGLNVQSLGATHSRAVSEDKVGIWDGKEFVFIMNDDLNWWTIVKMVWKYGLAPIRTRNLVQRTIDKFLKFYEDPIFPFESLTQAVTEVGLLDTTLSPGSAYLERNRISPDFSREMIQSSTRVNYGQNLALIHGLGAAACMSTGNAMSVKDGNWLIFDGMLKASGADVRLNQTVTAIERNLNGTITVTSVPNGSDKETAVFDEVVIAGPLQYSNISISPLPKHTPKEPTPFVTLYVTLFSSPHKLSPKFFGFNDTDKVPNSIITTLPKDLDLGTRPDGVGPTNFWSISTLAKVKSPSAGNEEHFVYKIFSPEQPTAVFISEILGLGDSTDNDSTIGDLPQNDISWFYEKVWHPYPYLYPRSRFDPILLAPGLWYAGGIEAFVSTMETSALMGKNIAALIFKSWEETSTGFAKDSNADEF